MLAWNNNGLKNDDDDDDLNMYLSRYNENCVIFEVIFYNFVQISSLEEKKWQISTFFQISIFSNRPI